jgi:hypothetical protein
MREERRYATIVAVFAAALYLACVVAALGLISLYTNQDVITEPDAGPLIGPLMTAAATLAVFGCLVAIGLRQASGNPRITPLLALAVGVAVYVIYIVIGGIVYSFGSSQPTPFLSFAGRMLGTWFSASTGILAFLIVLAYELVLIGRFRQRGRPLWPWEHHDQ